MSATTDTMKRTNERSSATNVSKLVKIAMLAAVATVLMLVEFPLPFIAPPFYELDFSEVPVLIGAFAMGPLAGAIIELIKILLNFVLNGTVTAGVGELGNFIVGCALIVPAAMIYKKSKIIFPFLPVFFYLFVFFFYLFQLEITVWKSLVCKIQVFSSAMSLDEFIGILAVGNHQNSGSAVLPVEDIQTSQCCILPCRISIIG